MSFAPEVIADSSGKWCGNALRFATEQEVAVNVCDLSMRWFAVREMRVVESSDPVNYRYIDGRLVPIDAPPPLVNDDSDSLGRPDGLH